MTSTTQPRGIRNNNPGNLRRSKDPWQGLAEKQGDTAFFTFKNSVYGIRALARTLIAYQDKHELRTIEEIIARWAPALENNTDAYIKAVTDASGFGADHRPVAVVIHTADRFDAFVGVLTVGFLNALDL